MVLITASCVGNATVRHPPRVVFTTENLQRQVDGTAGSTSRGNVQNQGDYFGGGCIASLCIYGTASSVCPSCGRSERHGPASPSDLWPADVLPGAYCRDGGRSTKVQCQEEGSGGIRRPKIHRSNGRAVCHRPASQLHGRDSVLVGFVRRRCSLLRGRNAVAWTFSTLGLWGILSIMLGSTKRLEKKQEDMYGKQEKYEKWKQNVRWPLIPFVERELTIAPGAK